MTEERESQARPKLWPSLLGALILATCLSFLWLTQGPARWLDFRILLAPIYIPLGFGILWPVWLAIESLTANTKNKSGMLPRHWVAIVLFLLSAVCWTPFVIAEKKASDLESSNKILQKEQSAKVEAERTAAKTALREKGILAFMEPFGPEEEGILGWHMEMERVTPEELQQASEHYRSPTIMASIAKNHDCPSSALEIIYEHAMAEMKNPNDPGEHDQFYLVYLNLATNPNITPELLDRMVRSGNPLARMEAVRNPRLPMAAKMAYLKKGCQYEGPFEPASVAGNLDTLADVLSCLATKGDTQYELAKNPHTPVDILENYAESNDYWAKVWSKENLEKRGIAAK
jgi:hypothetical protein